MRISTDHVVRLLETRLSQLRRAPESVRVPRPTGDTLALSAKAEELRLALAAARGGQFADPARLAALGRSVREGSYRVPSAALSKAILRELGP